MKSTDWIILIAIALLVCFALFKGCQKIFDPPPPAEQLQLKGRLDQYFTNEHKG